MPAKAIGKHEVLQRAFSKDGSPVLEIWCGPFTVYERKDGTFFILKSRLPVTRRPDGRFDYIHIGKD